MSDSDARSNLSDLEAARQEKLNDAIADTVDDIAPEIEKVLAKGEVLLSGPASVQFIFQVEDAATPQEAVELVVRKISHVGFDAITFAVTDMLSGDDYFVQAGQLLKLGEIEKNIKAAEDEQT